MKSRLELNQINKEMIAELNSTKGNIRAVALVFQSHVEFYINEIFEVLFETSEFKGISFAKKLAVLKELGYLSDSLGNDLRILFSIRGRLSHQRKTHDLDTKIQILNDLKMIKVVTAPKEPTLDEIRKFKSNMTNSKLLKDFLGTIKYVFRLFVFQISHVYTLAYETKTQKRSLKNMFKV